MGKGTFPPQGNDVLEFPTVIGNVIPAIDNTFDIGSSALKWKTSHISVGEFGRGTTSPVIKIKNTDILSWYASGGVAYAIMSLHSDNHVYFNNEAGGNIIVRTSNASGAGNNTTRLTITGSLATATATFSATNIVAGGYLDMVGNKIYFNNNVDIQMKNLAGNYQSILYVSTTDVLRINGDGALGWRIDGSASGTLAMGSNPITNIGGLSVTSTNGIYNTVDNTYISTRGGTNGAGKGAWVVLSGKDSGNAGLFELYTPNVAGNADVLRFKVTGVLATAVATWADVTHTGMVLSGLLLPNASNTIDLGSTSAEFKDIFFAGSLYTGATQVGRLYDTGGEPYLESTTVSQLHLVNKHTAGAMYLDSERVSASNGTAFLFRTFDASNVITSRLGITGGVTTAVATWSAITHTGMVLSGALNANSQSISNCGDVNMAGGKNINMGANNVLGIGWTTHVLAEVTLSGGTITLARGSHSVDTEGDSASDDLDAISGGADGMALLLFAESDTRTVVVKHGTGNIVLAGGADFSLDSVNDNITLRRRGTTWVEVSRSNIA
jgi:hypothetical protein